MEGNADDMFSQMLSELDDLTQQLDAVQMTPTPAAAPAPSFHVPAASYQPSTQPPQPKAASISSTTTTTQQATFPQMSASEDLDLTSMLDDLSNFEDNLTNTASGLDIKSTSHDSGIGFQDGSSRSMNFLTVEDGTQKFDTLKRVGAKGPGYSSSPFKDNYEDDDEDEFDDDLSLQKLSEAIDVEQKSAKVQALTEEELASLTPEEREERIKSEKMRVALEKMKEARIQKLVVKVFNKDESSKTLMIDERMTVRNIMKQLIEKNHFDFSPNWALIEEIPSLFMERMFEEHEKPCDLMSYWTRDTTNQLRFIERKDKYALFKNPQHYLLSHSDHQEQMQERQKQTLLEEFFSGKGPSSGVPEVESFLHIKGDGKSWTKKYCVLRSSGLYVSKSGEPKKGKRVADLNCLIMFDQCQLYLGRGWKKKFKSPFEYGFALKHPAIQVKSKHIRYLCCEDFKSLMRWTVGIRLAKYGRQLLTNYEKTNEEVKAISSAGSPFSIRPHNQSESPANRSSAAADQDNYNSKSGSLPRSVGVKNLFGGAWNRANQETSNEVPVANVTRAKSVWKPTAKKSNNWWDLDQGQANDQTGAEEPPATQPDRSSYHTDRSSYSPSVLPPPSNFPPPSSNDEYLPPPPPAPESVQAPLPPPAPKPSFVPPHPAPKPSSSVAPPPPAPKPSSFPIPPAKAAKPLPHVPPKPPSRNSNTFMSYNDLPPPPPADPSSMGMPPPPSQAGLPPPPPIESDVMPPPPPASYGMPPPPPMQGFPPPVASKKMPPPVPSKGMPPPPPGPKPNRVSPSRNYSNNNNGMKPAHEVSDEEPPPPSFHPPPPKKLPYQSLPPPSRKPKPIKNFSSPLTMYYENGFTKNQRGQMTYTIDDFPPPPPFVYDIKNSHHRIAEKSRLTEKNLIQGLPRPNVAQMSRGTGPKSSIQKKKKVPCPPARSASTRLSSKRK